MAEVSAVATDLVQPGGSNGGGTDSPPVAADPTKQQGAIQAVNAPFQIKPLSGENRWLKALVYGAHGAGKTELAGSAVDVPGMSDVLMVSAESGEMTLEQSVRIKNAQRIQTVRVTNFREVAHVHDYLVAHCKHRDTNNLTKLREYQSMLTGVPKDSIADENLFKFRTVIMDSVTEIESYSMYSLLGMDSTQMIKDDIEVADWPVFRKNFEQVKLLLRAYRNLPMHVIMVCSRQWVQDERKQFHFTPQMTGKLSTAVLGFVDLVGFLVVGNPSEGHAAPRRLYIQPVSDPLMPKFEAKCRRATIAQPYFDNPLMQNIMNAVGLSK